MEGPITASIPIFIYTCISNDSGRWRQTRVAPPVKIATKPLSITINNGLRGASCPVVSNIATVAVPFL